MKASIIIRAFNAEETIVRAIESAREQTYEGEYEVCIINDGSTDGTARQIQKYASHSHIRVHNQDNLGAVRAANTGFAMALGDYVCLLDSDDEYDPHFLAEMVRSLEADTSAHFAFSNYYEDVEGTRTLIDVDSVWKTIAGNVLYQRHALIEEGMYREAASLFPEYDLLLRTFGRWKGIHVPGAYLTYRRRKSSLTGDISRVHTALETLAALHPARRSEIAQIRSYVM